MQYLAPDPVLKEQFHQGLSERAYALLGSHAMMLNGEKAWHFAVWAPNAEGVSLVGDFNDWDIAATPMDRLETGVWTCTLPESRFSAWMPRVLYKYAVKGCDGKTRLHCDPYGLQMELRPNNATVLYDLKPYAWQDAEWMQARTRVDLARRPVHIYEVHLGSWRIPGDDRAFLNYREIADSLIPYVRSLNYTHVELMPVMEHLLDASWGYEIIGYFAATGRHGTPEDLQYFINRCHQEGIGVILDWAPAHFPKDEVGLQLFDGTHLYDQADPRRSEARRWDTLLFDLGRGEVQSFLLSSACFWLKWFHADGLRVDSVSAMIYHDFDKQGDEWVPNQYGGRENLEGIAFLQRLNQTAAQVAPGCMMIAEETQAYPGVTRTSFEGGLGFTLKWNQGWTSDILAYTQLPPEERRWHHDKLTFSLFYAFSERFILPFSHDENSGRSLLSRQYGDASQRAQGLRALYAYMIAHPGKKLSFMGNEFGQEVAWQEARGIDWKAAGTPQAAKILNCVRRLNELYLTEAPLYEVDDSWSGFQWLQANDPDNSVLAFLRWDKSGHAVMCLTNFGFRGHAVYMLGLPVAGALRQIFSTDDEAYGGSGQWNNLPVQTQRRDWHEFRHAVELRVPPLSTVYYAFERKV